MAVSAVYFVAPNQVARHHSGRTYSAAASGLLTVAYADASPVGGLSSVYPLLYLTGTTADRLSLNPTAARPVAPPKVAFWDTTLTVPTFYVGPQLSSTSWVDYNGNIV